MKTSRFNRFLELASGVQGLSNTLTGALTALDHEADRLVPAILEDPRGEVARQNPQLTAQLLRGGFLLDEHADELTDLRIRNGRHRFGSAVFSLAVAPTFDCNLACPGCASRNDKLKMSPAAEKALLAFAQDRIRRADAVRITWFGGEPLLRPETIDRVQTGLAAAAARFGAELEAGRILTNGTLLDGRTAGWLKGLGIDTAEVTLAGPEGRHDRIRVDAGGQGTFETVVNRLRETASTLTLVLRIEFDPRDLAPTRELVAQLDGSGLLASAQMYFAPAGQYGGACASVRGRCEQESEALLAQLDLYAELRAGRTVPLAFPYLLPVERCGFDSENSFLVAPSGYLYRCFEEVGLRVDSSVGTIYGADREPFQAANQKRFSAWDPFERADCPDCAVLPVCMGGCVRYGSGQPIGKCRFWRGHLPELQRLRVRNLPREEVNS